MNAKQIISTVFLGIYGVALLVCFICNLAISHTLSWFFIVLCGLGIAFSAINLPLILNKHRLVFAAAGSTVFTYLLLYVCNLLTTGKWFFPYAFPIATFPIVFLWMMIAVLKLKGLNWWFKWAIDAALLGLMTLLINPWIYSILDGGLATFGNNFVLQFTFPEGLANLGNVIMAFCFFIYAIVGISLGATSQKRKRLKSSTNE